MKNRKGISLSITAIVTITIGVVVLLVVLGYFIGGFGKTGSGVTEVAEGADTGTDWSEKVEGAMDIFSKECEEDADCDDAKTCVDNRCVE